MAFVFLSVHESESKDHIKVYFDGKKKLINSGSKPYHSLIIVGSSGLGKSTFANAFTKSNTFVVNSECNPTHNVYSYLYHDEKENKHIIIQDGEGNNSYNRLEETTNRANTIGLSLSDIIILFINVSSPRITNELHSQIQQMVKNVENMIEGNVLLGHLIVVFRMNFLMEKNKQDEFICNYEHHPNVQPLKKFFCSIHYFCLPNPKKGHTFEEISKYSCFDFDQDYLDTVSDIRNIVYELTSICDPHDVNYFVLQYEKGCEYLNSFDKNGKLLFFSFEDYQHIFDFKKKLQQEFTLVKNVIDLNKMKKNLFSEILEKSKYLLPGVIVQMKSALFDLYEKRKISFNNILLCPKNYTKLEDNLVLETNESVNLFIHKDKKYIKYEPFLFVKDYLFDEKDVLNVTIIMDKYLMKHIVLEFLEHEMPDIDEDNIYFYSDSLKDEIENALSNLYCILNNRTVPVENVYFDSSKLEIYIQIKNIDESQTKSLEIGFYLPYEGYITHQTEKEFKIEFLLEGKPIDIEAIRKKKADQSRYLRLKKEQLHNLKLKFNSSSHIFSMEDEFKEFYDGKDELENEHINVDHLLSEFLKNSMNYTYPKTDSVENVQAQEYGKDDYKTRESKQEKESIGTSQSDSYSLGYKDISVSNSQSKALEMQSEKSHNIEGKWYDRSSCNEYYTIDILQLENDIKHKIEKIYFSKKLEAYKHFQLNIFKSNENYELLKILYVKFPCYLDNFIKNEDNDIIENQNTFLSFFDENVVEFIRKKLSIKIEKWKSFIKIDEEVEKTEKKLSSCQSLSQIRFYIDEIYFNEFYDKIPKFTFLKLKKKVFAQAFDILMNKYKQDILTFSKEIMDRCVREEDNLGNLTQSYENIKNKLGLLKEIISFIESDDEKECLLCEHLCNVKKVKDDIISYINSYEKGYSSHALRKKSRTCETRPKKNHCIGCGIKMPKNPHEYRHCSVLKGDFMCQVRENWKSFAF
jgi:dephospho-CoA kinase